MTRIMISGCCGKMGQIVAQTALEFEDIQVVAGFDRNQNTEIAFPIFNNLDECDVEIDAIIDFSLPVALKPLLTFAIAKSIPVVLCTTGYSEEELDMIKDASTKIPVFFSANMSIGVNVVNNALKQLTKALYEDFDIEIIEKHHNRKVDAPSGTAYLLGDTVRDCIPHETEYVHGRSGKSKRESHEIGMHAIRGGNIVGEHTVIYASNEEIIEIQHSALSRRVFAVGALKASKYISSQKIGMYNMDNMLEN